MSRRSPLIVVLLLLAAATASTQQNQTDWKDHSPHVTRLVTVEDGVQVEVLDWGGSPRPGSGQVGPALVLLSGLGGTAHQFDDVAPVLASRHRVIGMTRRGHRGSSAAPGG